MCFGDQCGKDPSDGLGDMTIYLSVEPYELKVFVCLPRLPKTLPGRSDSGGFCDEILVTLRVNGHRPFWAKVGSQNDPATIERRYAEAPPNHLVIIKEEIRPGNKMVT